MKAWLKRYWDLLSKPSVHFSLGFLTLGGFIAGIIFWGGFNTAMEVTNTEPFCIACHEMQSNPYQELQGTIHWSNRSGVRATCSDCHVPHGWTDKIARKMQAKPTGRAQTVVEWAFEFVDSTIVKDNIKDQKTALKWFPFIATLFLFIWFSNMIGYIPLPAEVAKEWREKLDLD